jgi:hypothetical protein
MRNIRGVVVAVTAAGALLAGGATPAFAASAPKVPAGCSFDQAVGVLTCTSTTTTQIGPMTTADQGLGAAGVYPGGTYYWNSANTTISGFAPAQICKMFTGHLPTVFGLYLVVVDIVTTTTTERHGLQGRVFETSSSTSLRSGNTPSAIPGAGTIACS